MKRRSETVIKEDVKRKKSETASQAKFTKNKGAKNKTVKAKTAPKHKKEAVRSLRERNVLKSDNPEAKTYTERKKSKKENEKHEFHGEINKLGEKLRSKTCTPDQKTDILNRLKTLLKGRIKQVVRSHDLSRVIQWMIKLGPPQIQDLIMKEVITDISEITKCKYSNHVVTTAMKYCNSVIRKRIIDKLCKDILTLIKSKFSAPVIEDIYTNYANSLEKTCLRRAVYGDKIGLIRENLALLQRQEATLAPAIMSSTKSNLLKVLQKDDWCLKSSLVHFVLSDFLSTCTVEDRKELINSLRPHIPKLILTKEGCYAALNIIWDSTPKEKKVLIKKLQENIFDLAITESGSFFILSLIDSVDDTVLMNKALLSKLMSRIDELINNNSGRKIIIYIFLHRAATAFFSQVELKKLKEADSSVHLKKESTQRLCELQQSCIMNVLQSIRTNTELWFSNGPLGILLPAIFENAIITRSDLRDEVKTSLDAIALYVVNAGSTVSEEGKNVDLIEDSRFHCIVKKLIQRDSFRLKNNMGTFSESLTTQLSKEILMNWVVSNRGCFCILLMLELTHPAVTSTINDFFGNSELFDILNTQTSAGGQLLKRKLSYTLASPADPENSC